MGDTLMLPCETNRSAGVKWTRYTTHDGFSHVYINGSIAGHHQILKRFSMVSAGTLRIYNVQPTDSGLYHCDEANGTKIVGYYLVVEGMFLIVLKCKVLR